MRSLIAIGNFSVLLVLFCFIWSILGMELFAYRAVMDEDHNFIDTEEAMKRLEAGENLKFPRENFNDFWFSLISVYILINGEDWNQLMNTFVRSFNKTLNRGEWIPMVYCVIGLVIGNLTLLSIFTGVLLNNFSG